MSTSSPSNADPGRLRGRALVDWRRARAVGLARQGLCYEEIAAKLGYANRSGPWKAVQAALKRRTAEDVDLLRAVEDARLDFVVRQLAPLVLAGNLRAADGILKVVDRRIRLYRLDEVHAREQAPMGIVTP